MKVVYVVDSVSDLTKKINTVTNRFGTNIVYLVRADLVELFKTYGFTPNAIYYKNLADVLHLLLLKGDVEDTILCHASLNFNNQLLNKFANTIGDKSKFVNLVPEYNWFEQMCNSAYNVYVKTLFKLKDSLISPKLQFIPQAFVKELLTTHIGNRLFEVDPEIQRNIHVEEKEINQSMKTKTNLLKYDIISLIIALLITVGLLASIAYLKVSYFLILSCIILFSLDIVITIILHCKAKFDQRFLK
jgi:hypothetical protein